MTAERLKRVKIEFAEPAIIQLEIKNLTPVSNLIKQGILKGKNRLILLPPQAGEE